jgi:hypothetical protein
VSVFQREGDGMGKKGQSSGGEARAAAGRRCSSPVSQRKKRGEGRGSSELACLSAAGGDWRIHVIARLSER